MFEPSVYASRRAHLVRTLHDVGKGNGLVLLPGNRPGPINYEDNAYMFRQDSSFLYYIGLAEPDMFAAIDCTNGVTTLYAGELTESMLVWTGPRPGLSELASLAGIARVASPEHLAGELLGRDVLYLPPYRADTVLDLASLLGMTPAAVREGSSMPLIRAVIEQRQIKEAREIGRIEEAVSVSVDIHAAVLKMAGPGVSETALMAKAVQTALAAGGMPSFQPIATTRGAVLHNHGYSHTLTSGGLFLLDAGAETDDGYAGDLTTTFPVSGRYSSRHRDIYEIVLKAGKAAVDVIRPGVPYRAAHDAAALAIATGLRDLGLMKGSPEDAVAAGAHALFFPHGIGHQMGLDVHDMEALGEVNVGYDGAPKSVQVGLRSVRMAKAVSSGMVLTVEPGIYFIEGLVSAWKAEKKFEKFIQYEALEGWLDFGGIRNEEDWLVTDGGARRLGKTFDKSADAIEAAMGGDGNRTHRP